MKGTLDDLVELLTDYDWFVIQDVFAELAETPDDPSGDPLRQEHLKVLFMLIEIHELLLDQLQPLHDHIRGQLDRGSPVEPGGRLVRIRQELQHALPSGEEASQVQSPRMPFPITFGDLELGFREDPDDWSVPPESEECEDLP